MRTALFLLGAWAHNAAADAPSPPIAGYAPGSDVTEHNKIDLDQAAMETALGTYNWTSATKWYAEGGNSVSKGKFRTLKGFSTGAQGKMYDDCPGCPYHHYEMFYDYYGDFDYADKWVSAALAGETMSFSSGKHGPNDFTTLGEAARAEAAKKGSAYMNVWMYAIREFEDAIDDCSTCTSECNAYSVNSGSVHAWDEGVAFYSGTLEGTEDGGDSSGKLVYRLAEKRCQNFGTCGFHGDETSGTASVNLELFKLFAEGRDLLQKGHCAAVRPITNKIVSLMTVPLVQGSLRYAYKIGLDPSSRSQKNAAEGATFSAAVLPLVNYCNPASAKIISENQKFGLYDAGTYPNFATVKKAFEETYACLGITCKQVGGLVDPDTGVPLVAATAACTTQDAPIAGYYPGSDVTEHNKIDLDQAAMETALGTYNWTAATKWYAEGGNSVSGNSVPVKFRTLKGFSTGAQGKMYDNCPGCPYHHYEMFYDYYGDFDYADKWVSAALAGETMSFSSGKHGPNDFTTLGEAARAEAAKKGSAYMNVWMYAIREFEDAIDDCSTCTSECNAYSVNSGSVHAWDEGVAFYSGTLEGTEDGGDSSGKLVYRLAEKRCQNFGTCGFAGDETSGTASVNLELFKLFAEGRDLLQKGHCAAVRPITNKIVSLMTVPLVQGSLRYAYKIGLDPSSRSQKNAAEGATFSAAVLPLVNYCNPASAKIISENQKFGLYDAGTYPDFAAVKTAFEETYNCLGITCKHVGGLVDSSTGVPLDAATAACTVEPTNPSPPPPPPPPPPPSTTDVYVVYQVAEMEVTVAGTIETADLAAFEEDLKATLCEGLTDCSVTVTIKAGSTVLNVKLMAKAAVSGATTTVAEAATSFEANPPATIGGAAVEAVSTPVISTEMVKVDPDDDGGLSTGAIIGIAVGGGVGGLCLIVIIVMMFMKMNAKQSYGGNKPGVDSVAA